MKLSKENCRSRCCSRNTFDVMFCEYERPAFDNAKLTLVKGAELKVIEKISLKDNKESLLSAVYLKGEVYTIVNSSIYK